MESMAGYSARYVDSKDAFEKEIIQRMIWLREAYDNEKHDSDRTTERLERNMKVWMEEHSMDRLEAVLWGISALKEHQEVMDRVISSIMNYESMIVDAKNYISASRSVLMGINS